MNWLSITLPDPDLAADHLALMHHDIVGLHTACHDETGIHKPPAASTQAPGFTIAQEALARLAIRLHEFCTAHAVSPEAAKLECPIPPSYAGNHASMALITTSLHADVVRISTRIRKRGPAVGTFIHRIEQTAERLDHSPHPEGQPGHWWLGYAIGAMLQ